MPILPPLQALLYTYRTNRPWTKTRLYNSIGSICRPSAKIDLLGQTRHCLGLLVTSHLVALVRIHLAARVDLHLQLLVRNHFNLVQ